MLPLIKIKNGEKHYLKLTYNQRIQHFFIMTTFILLVATGFPLKFHYYPWAEPLINLFGGVKSAGIIHRISGVIMVGHFFYHWYYIISNVMRNYVIPAKKTNSFSWGELGRFLYYSPMCPRKKDAEDIAAFIKYATFISDDMPKHERFHWREKFDYWAVFWGIPVLGLTGLFLWFPVWATSFLPGWAINISYIAHSDEAMLAVSVIFLWHMYNAHVNYDKFPMSPLFMTGYLPEHLMKHEYFMEWNRINRIVEKDPSRMLDLDKEREAETLTNQEKIDLIREQIEYMKESTNGGKYNKGGSHHE